MCHMTVNLSAHLHRNAVKCAAVWYNSQLNQTLELVTKYALTDTPPFGEIH